MCLFTFSVKPFFFFRLYILLFFNKLKVCANPESRKSIGAIFPKVLAHLVSHFDNSSNISNFFIIIILVMVICDYWSLMLLPRLAEGSDGDYHLNEVF